MPDYKTHLCSDGKPEDAIRASIPDRKRFEFGYNIAICADPPALARGSVCALAETSQTACAEYRCDRRQRLLTEYHERANTFATLVDESFRFAGHWHHRRDRLGLTLGRLLRAIPVAMLTEDPRLKSLEKLASKILDDHKEYEKTEAFEGEIYPWDCAQPYEATFEIYGGDLAATTREEVAVHLRKTALRSLGTMDSKATNIELGRDPNYQLPVENHGRWLAQIFYLSLIEMRPDIEKPGFQVPESIYDFMTLEGEAIRSTPPPIIATLGQAIARVLERIERGRWNEEETAESIVRCFFRGLGMSENEAESLFDAERKRRKREAAREVQEAKPPKGEGNDGPPFH